MKIIARVAMICLIIILTGCGLFGSNNSVTGIEAKATINAVLSGFSVRIGAEVKGTGTFDQKVIWTTSLGQLSANQGSLITYTAPAVTTDTLAIITVQARGDNTKKVSLEILVKAPIRNSSQSLGSTGGVIAVRANDLAVGAGSIDPNALTSNTAIKLEQTTILDSRLPSGLKAIGTQTVMTIPVTQIANSQAIFSVASKSQNYIENQGDAFGFVQIDFGNTKVLQYSDIYIPNTKEAIGISAIQLRTLIALHNPSANNIKISLLPLQKITVKKSVTQVRATVTAPISTMGLYRIDGIKASENDCNTEVDPAFFLQINSVNEIESTSKIPLILIHGWQGINGVQETLLPIPKTKKTFEFPGVCNWITEIPKFLQLDDYQLYTFSYNSYNQSIRDNADQLGNAMRKSFGNRKVVIVAHSKGGMIADLTMHKFPDINVAHLFSLGTPYLGSIALLCTKTSSGLCSSAILNPNVVKEATKKAIELASSSLSTLASVPKELIPALAIVGGYVAMDAIDALTKVIDFQGTKDLTWSKGGIEVWQWDWGNAGWKPTLSVDNPVLSEMQDPIITNKITGYIGDASQPNATLKPLKDIIFQATGHLNDGIVPFASASLNTQINLTTAPSGDQISGSILGKVIRSDLDHLGIKDILTIRPLPTLPEGLQKELFDLAQSINAPGTIGGLVQDAIFKTPVPNATINIGRNGTVKTTTSNSTGTYSLQVPSGTGYTVTITKTGYKTATKSDVEVIANQSRSLETLLFIDSAQTGNGNISGTITNSFNGNGVTTATINLRTGLNVHTGTIFSTSATNSSGVYQFTNATVGYYTAEVLKSGFITGFFDVISIPGANGNNQNFSITPVIAASEIRVVLTWGAIPSDLDSHLTGPDDSGGRFHVFFRDENFTGTTTTANLDVDDMSSYGPETITINNAGTGLYRYSVHDYSNYGSATSALSNSSARVQVFQGSGSLPILDEFVPVAQLGDLWTVFEIENGVIRRVNSLTTTGESATVQSTNVQSRSGNNELQLFSNLPKK